METTNNPVDAAIEGSAFENKNHPHTDWVPAQFARNQQAEIAELNRRVAVLVKTIESSDALNRKLLVENREKDAQIVALREALQHFISVGCEFYDMDMGENGCTAIGKAQEALALTSARQ